MRICSRGNFLIAGSLLLCISPLLSCAFYIGAAILTLFDCKREDFTRERILLAGVILIVSLWMVSRKVLPENFGAGFVAFSDYAPFFVFFFLISLKPFTEIESRGFAYSLTFTIPQQFLLAYGERYWGWHGRFFYPYDKLAAVDIWVGPMTQGGNVGCFFNPNILALYVIIVTVISLALLVVETKKIRSTAGSSLFLKMSCILEGCVFILGVILTVWTNSRNGWLAFLFFTLVFLIVYGKRWYFKVIYLLLPLLTLIASGGKVWLVKAANFILPGSVASFIVSVAKDWLAKAAYFVVPKIMASRLHDAINYSSAGNNFLSEERSIVYKCAFQLIKERPLTGWGIGVFPQECAKRSVDAAHAHNIFLQLAVDIGVPFTIITVCFVGYILFASIRFLLKQRNNDNGKYSLDAGFMIVTTSVIFMQFFDIALLMTYRLNFLFWICFAIPYSRAFQAYSGEEHETV